MNLIEMDQTLRALPNQARQEAMDFVEFLSQKYVQKQSQPPVSLARKILSYAGAWQDMEEADYQILMTEIKERREKSSTRRRERVLKYFLFDRSANFCHYKRCCRV